MAARIIKEPGQSFPQSFSFSLSERLDDYQARESNIGSHDYVWEKPEREKWMKEAACLGVPLEVFDTRPNAEDAPAKRYCHGNKAKGIPPCPVQMDCLLWLLLTEPPTEQRYLFQGGVGPAEREKIYQKMKENLK